MDKNRECFLGLLSAFIKEESLTKLVNLKEVDWQEVYRLARIHAVSGAVYISIQKLNDFEKPSEEIIKKFKTDFFNTTLRYEEQEREFQKIIKKLNENKIKHIFFKGSVVREYYPVKQMRTCGDFDFLLHEEDHYRVKAAMEELGYINTQQTGHWIYEKGKLNIEVHDRLLYRQIKSNFDYISYFEGAWKNVIATDQNYTYNLKLEYHLIFLLSHLAKHFTGPGAGVRMVLDIAIILNKFSNSIDFEYLWDELMTIKLDDFAGYIFEICNRWYGVTVSSKTCIDEEALEAMVKYIIDAGTFGFTDRNQAVHMIRSEYENVGDEKRAKFMALFKLFFRSYSQMKILYPILEKLPFLLPFTWIARGINRATKKTKHTFRILKGFKISDNEASQSYAMMKKIGL